MALAAATSLAPVTAPAERAERDRERALRTGIAGTAGAADGGPSAARASMDRADGHAIKSRSRSIPRRLAEAAADEATRATREPSSLSQLPTPPLQLATEQEPAPEAADATAPEQEPASVLADPVARKDPPTNRLDGRPPYKTHQGNGH